MRIIPTSGPVIELGTAEINPTVGMIDYSRRVTDDFGMTTVVKRGFVRKISARVMMPFDQVSAAQNSLAKLRAQSARWEFDPDYDWLDFDGFYREFDLDLAVPPNSFCTLSVEGLAETEAGADDGSDPSPQDASTLIVVDPVAMTDAALISTNVPENDYSAWLAGTTYALGARVIKVATHRIYESASGGNVGNDPATASGHWFDIGPTNRWAMFDQALGTATTRNGGMTMQIGLGSVRAIALLDVVATSVRVQVDGFDQTKSAATGSVIFLDLPNLGGTITVTVAGSGIVSVGTLLTGHVRKLGKTGEAPSAGITDFSRKEVDGFGAPTIVERAWAKRMQARALISTTSLDKVANRIAHLRATPALWIADDGTEALTIYGFFKEFSIEVGQTVSTLSLSVEGLSKAVYVAPAAEILDVAEKKIFVPLETARQHNIGDLVARATALAVSAINPAPLNALISGLTASNVIWLLFRNAITPLWNDVTASSARDYTIWLTLNNAVDDAIPALQRAISEEDARRSVWDQTTARPPLLTGDSVTADDTLRDPSVWTQAGGQFLVDGNGEGYFLANAVVYSAFNHLNANATPIDHNATYEATYELFEGGSGVGTARNYTIVLCWDAAGNLIAGDGTYWYYPTLYEKVWQRSTWERHSARFGKGTARPFPANAVKFGLGCLLNYDALSPQFVAARRLKTKRIAVESMTSAKPWQWSLADGTAVLNATSIGDSWSQIAYGKAFIAGAQRFTFQMTKDATVAGLTDVSAPTDYTVIDGSLNWDGASLLYIIENGSAVVSYPGYSDISARSLTVEYDGAFLRYYVDGVALAYSSYVGGGKSFKSAVSAYRIGGGVSSSRHESGPAVAVVGGNTFDGAGNALGGLDLLNVNLGVNAGGQWFNQAPGAIGNGRRVANDAINVTDANASGLLRYGGGGLFGGDLDSERNNRLTFDYDAGGAGGRVRQRLLNNASPMVIAQLPTGVQNRDQLLADVNGAGALAALSNIDLAGTYATGTLPVARAALGLRNDNLNITGGALFGIGPGTGTPVANALLTIAPNGALSGGGGGAVTLPGLGFSGANNATANFGALADLNELDLASGYLSGTLPVARAALGLRNAFQLWDEVGGANRPESYATGSDNTIINGGMTTAANWLIAAGSPYWTASTVGSQIAGYFSFAGGGYHDIRANDGSFTPLNGATSLFVSAHAYKTGAAVTFNCGALFFDAAGTYLGAAFSSIVPTATGAWELKSGVIAVPSTAVKYTIAVYADANASLVGVSNVRAAHTEREATRGAIAGINFRRSGGALASDAETFNDFQRYDQVVDGFGRPADNATANFGALADLNAVALGTGQVTGTLPVGQAAAGLVNANVTLPSLGFIGDADAERNNRVTIADGVLYGIGTAGREVDNNVIVTLQEPSGYTFLASSAGVITPAAQLPATFRFKLFRGATDVSLTTTWNVLSQSGISGGTVTIADGVANVPSGCAVLNTGATIQISATRGGVTRYGKVDLSRSDAPAPSGSGGGTSDSDYTLNSVTTASMVAISDEISFNVGSSGVATFSGGLSIIAAAAANAGSFGAKLRWKIKLSGGSYTNVGSVDIDDSYPAFVFYDNELIGGGYSSEDGSIDAADVKTGLSAANNPHTAQLFASRDDATLTKTLSFGGGVTATGS